MLQKLIRELKNKSQKLGFRSAVAELKRSRHLLDTMRAYHLGRPQMGTVPEGKRVVILAPHPDDELIGPGGALLQMLKNQCQVAVIYVTDGDRDEAGVARRAEAAQVAHSLGYGTVFLGLPADRIATDPPSLEALRKSIFEGNPDLLLLPFLLDDNSDHRRVSELLMKALESNPPQFQVWAYQVYTSLPGNYLVDITSQAEWKARAISTYQTQNQKRDLAHFALGLNAYNSRLAKGGPQVKYVEAYYSMPFPEYLALCKIYFGTSSEACYPGHPHY